MKRRCKLIGDQNNCSVKLNKNRPVKKIKINPSNEKIFAVMYSDVIEIFEIIENFCITGSNVNEGVRIVKKQQISLEENCIGFENVVWD